MPVTDRSASYSLDNVICVLLDGATVQSDLGGVYQGGYGGGGYKPYEPVYSRHPAPRFSRLGGSTVTLFGRL